MVSYQGMQSGFPVFLVGEFGTFEIFMRTDCFAKPDFSYFSNFIYKALNIGIVEKETPLNHPPSFQFFQKIK